MGGRIERQLSGQVNASSCTLAVARWCLLIHIIMTREQRPVAFGPVTFGLATFGRRWVDHTGRGAHCHAATSPRCRSTNGAKVQVEHNEECAKEEEGDKDGKEERLRRLWAALARVAVAIPSVTALPAECARGAVDAEGTRPIAALAVRLVWACDWRWNLAWVGIRLVVQKEGGQKHIHGSDGHSFMYFCQSQCR